MKKLSTVLAFVLGMLFVHAQGDFKTIFSQEDLKFSGFGGWNNELSFVNGQLVSGSSGGGGLLINQRFYMGGYGMGTNSFNLVTVENGQSSTASYSLGHGGVWLGYIHNYEDVFHFVEM